MFMKPATMLLFFNINFIKLVASTDCSPEILTPLIQLKLYCQNQEDPLIFEFTLDEVKLEKRIIHRGIFQAKELISQLNQIVGTETSKQT